MNSRLKPLFRVGFIIGCVLGMLSLFLDYYLFQAFDPDNTLIAFWSYSPFFDWHTIYTHDSVFNEFYRPRQNSIPFLIHVIFIVSVCVALYGTLFRDLEREKSSSNLRPFAYANLCVLILMGFYVVMFPIVYLFPSELYFPFVQYYDPVLEVQFYYSLHFGYVLQLISFLFAFPYALFYYQMVSSFRKSSQSPEEIVSNYLKIIQEPLDMDKFIREEELAIKSRSR